MELVAALLFMLCMVGLYFGVLFYVTKDMTDQELEEFLEELAVSETNLYL